MKLYRGIKSNEYKEITKDILEEFNQGWEKILKIRGSGNFKYPNELNEVILNLFKHQYLVRQYFTDDKKIAESYAKKENGLMLKIDVPIKNILKFFILEFQNYPNRKKSFEVTYIVKGRDLIANSKKWNLKIQKI